ncbi:hypothetical protein MO973_20865 [Paenibacillus sp. TRM 82003]|nr:hypothetical protein [Paenibacillus sp. TRM 82003]
MKIGTKIRHLRIYRNMTQGELVDGITSVAFLSKVENDLTKPSERFLTAVAKKLDVSPDFLLEDIPPGFSEYVRETLQNYWAQERLTEGDLLRLHIQIHNMHSNRDYVIMFTILIRYYFIQAKLKEAKELYDRSRTFAQLDDPGVEPSLYFYYFHTCGNLFIGTQDFMQAYAFFHRAEAYVDSVDRRSRARLYYNLSVVSQKVEDDPSVCLQYSKKCYDLLKEADEPERLISLLLTRCLQYYDAHQPDEAVRCLEEAQSIVSERSDPVVMGIIYYNHGRLHHRNNEWENAVACFHRALDVFKVVGDVPRQFSIYKKLAEMYLESKNWAELNATLQAADELSASLSKEELPNDVEWDLLKARIFKVQEEIAKYERNMDKIIYYCETNRQWNYLKIAASELAEHYYKKSAYKKAAELYRLSIGVIQEQHKHDKTVIK